MTVKSIYSYKLAHVQVVINCLYSVEKLCTREDGLAYMQPLMTSWAITCSQQFIDYLLFWDHFELNFWCTLNPLGTTFFCLTTSYIEWVVQWDLNNEHLNKENIWITNFTCFLLPLIVCYSSHDLNIELSKLNVCYSSSQSDKLSVKQPMTWKTQF